LLGLFVGVSLADRTAFSPGGELPARILLFQRNLERAFPAPELLTREIARTLHHARGHYLGLDEE
jgi:predicted Zn-dependent protease with MMP-like domain